MFARWQFWLVTVFVTLATLIIFAVTKIPLVLWIGGLALFFWINGRLREMIEDNYYINAAYTTLTVCVLTVPQIFYAGTLGGWILYAICAFYQLLAYYSNYEYTSDYTVGRDISRNWRSETKTLWQKVYGHYVIAEGNKAALILTGLGFLAGSFAIAAVSSIYSLFFLLLTPVYTFLWHLIAMLYIHILGLPIPTGFDWHESANNIPKGYWFLIWSVLKVILTILASPFVFIFFIFKKIAAFFGNIKNGGSTQISKFFWICVGALAIYLIISLFGAANFIERIFGGGFSGIDLEIRRFLFPITNFILDLEMDGSFFLDVILFLPKVLFIIVGALLDLVLLLVICLLWLLLNAILAILYVILVVSFEFLLPLALTIGAIVFVVLYLIDSDRDFFDWFRAILFAILPIGMFTLYILFAYGIIKLF